MFGILHADGSGEDNPSIHGLSDLYDELATSNREHGDVSVINDDSGWCISARRDGRVTVGHLSDPESDLHMRSVAKAKVIAMWKMLIAGDIAGLKREDWSRGHGS